MDVSPPELPAATVVTAAPPAPTTRDSVADIAIVEVNTVINVVEADPAYAAQNGWVQCTSGNVGDTYLAGNYTTPSPDMSKVRDGMICTLAQLKAALDDVGRLDEVDAVIASAPRRIRLVWSLCGAVTRKGKLIDYLKALETPIYSNSFLDNLFIEAMKIDL